VSRNARFRNLFEARPALARWVCLLLALASPLRAGADAVSPATNAFARVVIVQDGQAMDVFQPCPKVVQAMVDCAITNLTHQGNCAAAWLSLVSTQDIVGIKVLSHPGPNSGTRPAVTAAVVAGLLAAGLPPKHIVVWDGQSSDLRLAGYYDLARHYGIRVTSSAEAGYDPTAFYDNPLLGNLIWGDLDFGKPGERVGRKSYVTKLVTRQITKIINITPLLNHNLIGVSGNLFSLAMGSVDNTLRFEGDTDRLAVAVPEICALPVLRHCVVLNIVDALICQYEGGEKSLLHYSTILNQLRFSRDPVALDVLSTEELKRQRQLLHAFDPKSSLDTYANASLLELGISDPARIHVRKLTLP
jgi:Domain of unknown function (DUF362)